MDAGQVAAPLNTCSLSLFPSKSVFFAATKHLYVATVCAWPIHAVRTFVAAHVSLRIRALLISPKLSVVCDYNAILIAIVELFLAVPSVLGDKIARVRVR